MSRFWRSCLLGILAGGGVVALWLACAGCGAEAAGGTVST